MKDEELENLIKSDVIRCPHENCCEREKYNSCFNHSYVLCDNFKDWYDSLSGYEIYKIFYCKK